MAAPAGGRVMPWPAGIVEPAMARGARVELALVHHGRHRLRIERPLAENSAGHPAPSHRRIRRLRPAGTPADAARRRLGAVGRRRARVCALGDHPRACARPGYPSIFSAAPASAPSSPPAWRWDGATRRCSCAIAEASSHTNPVNDYTFPFLALTRGRKVSRLLEREYGDVLIEDLRQPYFCVSANLTTGRLFEHRSGVSGAGAARIGGDSRRHAAGVSRRRRPGRRRRHQQPARRHHAGPRAGLRDRQRCRCGPQLRRAAASIFSRF